MSVAPCSEKEKAFVVLKDNKKRSKRQKRATLKSLDTMDRRKNECKNLNAPKKKVAKRRDKVKDSIKKVKFSIIQF